MADVKTITEELEASGKEKENNYLEQEKRLEKLEQIISNMEK